MTFLWGFLAGCAFSFAVWWVCMLFIRRQFRVEWVCLHCRHAEGGHAGPGGCRTYAQEFGRFCKCTTYQPMRVLHPKSKRFSARFLP